MAPLRPLTKPKIVKKRTKKFIRHQSDRYVKIAVSYHLVRSATHIHRSLSTLLVRMCVTPKKVQITHFLSPNRKTGASPEVSTTGSAGASRGRCSCPTSVTVVTRRQSICCQVASRSSWCTMSRSWKFWWWATSKWHGRPTYCFAVRDILLGSTVEHTVLDIYLQYNFIYTAVTKRLAK